MHRSRRGDGRPERRRHRLRPGPQLRRSPPRRRVEPRRRRPADRRRRSTATAPCRAISACPRRSLYDRLPATGYRQSGWSAAGTLPFADGSALTGLAMQETQQGVSRYDRILGGDGLFRSEFDPQRLGFGYVRYQRNATGPFAVLQGTFSFNQQQDDRLEQARPERARTKPRRRATRVLGYAGAGHAAAVARPHRDHGRRGVRRGHRDQPRPLAGRRRVDAAAGDSRRRELHVGRRLRPGQRLASRRSARRCAPACAAAASRYDAPADAALGVSAERVRTSAVTFNTGVGLAAWPRPSTSPARSAAASAPPTPSTSAPSASPAAASRSRHGRPPSCGAIVGSNDGADGGLAPACRSRSSVRRSMYAFEGGAEGADAAAGRLAGVLRPRTAATPSRRRTAIFPQGIVGTSVAGYTIIAQDAEGRAYVSVDPRPIVTRVNVERGRIQGLEGDLQVRLARTWIGNANMSMANGRDGDDVYLRRMPPLMATRAAEVGAERASVLGRGRRDRSGDAGSPEPRRSVRCPHRRPAAARRHRRLLQRHGHRPRSRAGRATRRDRRDARAGAGPPAGRRRASYLYTETPGFVVFSLRGGWRLSSRLDATVILDNLTDHNYRWHGSGTDAPGFSLAAKLRLGCNRNGGRSQESGQESGHRPPTAPDAFPESWT